jgi:hypothetical protein
MKKHEKTHYVPPTVKTTRVILDNHIALSPIQRVDLENWHYDEYPISHESNNADVWLNL